MRILLDRSARLLADGTLVIGGSPPRLLHLTDGGAQRLHRWLAGTAVADAPGSGGALARRLIEAGIVHPRPEAGRWSADDVAVVIPARDRAALLARCVASVGPAAELVVVDDGSADPGAIRAVAARAGARVLRGDRPGGPAHARNAGAAVTAAPLVAFVDSDVTPRPGWLGGLLGHFEDPAVGAVAPRVISPPGTGPVAAYEAVRSPLDLGRDPGPVGPRRRTPFVPAAALIVRRDALREIGGFDETLRTGEDVDLEWRLSAAGWIVRYEPAVHVTHPRRATAWAWLGQRIAYGGSAAPLSRRHPGALRHLVVPAWMAVPALLGLAGRGRAGVATALGGGLLEAARLPAAPGARWQLLGWVARTQLRIAVRALDAGWRAYPPVLLGVCVIAPRARRPLAIALAAPVVADWLTLRPRVDPLRFAVLRGADDLAYATGVWVGCARARTLGPLVPELVRGSRVRPGRTSAVSVQRVLGLIGHLVDLVLHR